MTPTPTETPLDLARRRMLTAERIVLWRRAAKDLAYTLRDAAARRSDWDAVTELARAEYELALADLEHAEQVNDAAAEEMTP